MAEETCKCSTAGNGVYDFGKKCCRTAFLRSIWNINRPLAEEYLARWTKKYGSDAATKKEVKNASK